MPQEIRRAGLEAVLEELSYPAIRPDAAAEFREVTLVLEDRTVNLGAAISESGPDAFTEPEELLASLDDVLAEPTRS